MAKTARVSADIAALEALAERFERLAARHCAGVGPESGELSPYDTSNTTTDAANRTEELVAGHLASYPPCPEVPRGAEFAKAWQMACQHVSKRYVMPETLHHPVVIGECYRLACMILAYGLVPKRSAPAKFSGSQTESMPADRGFNAADHRVIVVDDVADVLVSVGAFLVKAGYAVRKASNGDDALQAIISDPCIDVLVTDFAMPGLNGADLISQASQVRPSLKALVITGYPNADGLSNLPTGTIVLTKPFRRDALVAAVKSLFVSDGPGPDETALVPATLSNAAEWPVRR